MATANGMPQREKVTFTPNVQQQIALKWPDGKIISNQYGDQVMYSLTDGRVMFLNTDVAAKINMLEVQRNEPFWICKRWSGQKGQPVRWDVWRGGERYVDEGVDPEPPSEIAIQLNHSIRQIQMRKGISPVPQIGASEPTPPRASVTPAPIASTVSSHGTAASSHLAVTDGRPKTRLEDALKTVIAALHAGNEYAKSIGFAMPQFTSEDIRCMCNTLMIEGRK